LSYYGYAVPVKSLKGRRDMDENVYRFASKMLLWYPERRPTNTV